MKGSKSCSRKISGLIEAFIMTQMHCFLLCQKKDTEVYPYLHMAWMDFRYSHWISVILTGFQTCRILVLNPKGLIYLEGKTTYLSPSHLGDNNIDLERSMFQAPPVVCLSDRNILNATSAQRKLPNPCCNGGKRSECILGRFRRIVRYTRKNR